MDNCDEHEHYLHILCGYSCADWHDDYAARRPFLLPVFGAFFDTSETEHAISIKAGKMGKK